MSSVPAARLLPLILRKGNRHNMMKEDDFRELVRRMREAQKNYFRTRAKSYLDYSRTLEKQVDEELQNDTPKLF